METITPVLSPSPDIPGQLVYHLPERLGAGFGTFEKFSSGLILAYMDFTLPRPVKIVGETTGWNCGMSFNLTGHSEICAQRHQQVAAKSGSIAHYAYPGLYKITENIDAGSRSKIMFLFDSKTLLNLAAEDEEAFLPFLQAWQREIPVVGQEKMTTPMKSTLHQLICCPYSGKIRSLYMEGKMMEIFADSLEQLRPKKKSGSCSYRLSKTDTERIQYAAELLVRNPIHPPNLNDLARKIGMGRSKFYQNFKMVFGHSPASHLRSHRMHAARRLLRQGTHNVAQAAFAVGFNDPSHFTRVFTAEFGISPRQIV